MKFIIRPKYQYILLFLNYWIITLISIINFIQVKKYKQALTIFILISIISVVCGLIIFEIVVENFNIIIFGISIRTLYIELFNIGVGYLLIRNQKKNILFD